jgi:high-affinity K+ transport system ATPase subunit B
VTAPAATLGHLALEERRGAMEGDIERAVRVRRQAAKQSIKVGATYRHTRGGRDVVVVDFNATNGLVQWQSLDGPGLADRFRQLDCEDFLTAYELKERENG